MANTFEIKEYFGSGNSSFADWFNSLDAITAARVDRYIRRLEAGNFGSVKTLQEGVLELKMDFGPGYRVYFGREGKTIIILLGGGSKRRQAADIAAAIEHGNDTNNRRINMALTREYKQTVLARIKRDPKFAKALYAEAVNALLEGETDEGLSMLHDLVHATTTFKTLSEQTGFGEKALHRMLSHQGNPTTRNLFTVTRVISANWGIRPRFKLAV